MAWRGVHISKPSRLNFADGQIVAKQDDGEARIPLEDLAWLVIDNPQVTLTTSLLSACMKAGVAITLTDETHTPCGMALPFHRHFQQGETARLQVEMTSPLKKRLWQAIIQMKIRNQATALQACGKDGARTLQGAASRVGSGDIENVEARAAKYYFGRLFGKFARNDEADVRNAMLNYGYAVIRSGVARALTASGFLPALGIKHCSQTNAFNLADDLVEPFRPFVDVVVHEMALVRAPDQKTLSVEDKQRLAGILLSEAYFGKEAVTLLVATERASESLARSIERGSPALLSLPELSAA
jgi:CRISPR-associated protein Cas1